MHMKAEHVALGMRISVAERIRYEMHLSWLFIKGDISATIVPTSLFTIAAWHSRSIPLYELVAALGSGLTYFWLYVCIFCVSNQLTGIEEDRLNKPYRPLARGIVSYEGALMRWIVLMALFTFVGWWLDLLGWALLWQAATVLHNFGGWARHWIGKHLVMGAGIVAGLAPAWELVTPLTPIAWRWIILLACTVMLLVAAQDLRDIAGDRVIGRQTLPIVFGEMQTRASLSFGFVLLPAVIYVGLIAPADSTWAALLCSMVPAAMSLWIAARIVLYRTRQADHQTYMLFTYWYCTMMLTAIVVL
ncbi:MAG TPA: UbiA family prenyltransferase [Herpetosiphonaceae bacterium]